MYIIQRVADTPLENYKYLKISQGFCITYIKIRATNTQLQVFVNLVACVADIPSFKFIAFIA